MFLQNRDRRYNYNISGIRLYANGRSTIKIYKKDKLICEGSFTTELSAENYLKSLPEENRIEDEVIDENKFILTNDDGQYKGLVFMNDTNTVIAISYYLQKEEIMPFMRTLSIVSETKK